jgi:hypothetical protein
MSGVPIAGIAAFFPASARQFVFWYRELVRLTGLYDDAAFPIRDLTGDRASEMTMAEPIEDDLT